MTRSHKTSDDDGATIDSRVVEGATILGLIIAAVVGGVSFKQSFSTLHDLAILAEHIADPWVTPIVLDGPILAAGVIRIALSQHKDEATVRGRRIVVAILVAAGLASMAGNAYHTVLLGAGLLHTAVAASIAALAPLMVMVMSEIVSIILRAPRLRRAASASTVDEIENTDVVEIDSDTPSDTDALSELDEDLDGGRLSPEVWKTVELFLDPNEARNYTKIAELRGISSFTVSRQISKWQHATMQIAAARSASRDANTGAQRAGGEGSGDQGQCGVELGQTTKSYELARH